MLHSIRKTLKQIISPDLKYSTFKPGKRLVTIGTNYGGWTIPLELLNSDSICYLAGAGEDISFDLGLAKQVGCTVHIFDPTPRSKKHYEDVVTAAGNGSVMRINNNKKELYELDKQAVKLLRFHELGVWKQKEVLKFFAPQDETHISHSISNLQHTSRYFEANVDRLSNLMQQNGHDHLNLLKIDIEGAEFEVIDSIIEDNLKINIFCVEFHQKDQKDFSEIQASINKLESNGYFVIARKDLDFTFLNKNFR